MRDSIKVVNDSFLDHSLEIRDSEVEVSRIGNAGKSEGDSTYAICWVSKGVKDSMGLGEWTPF